MTQNFRSLRIVTTLLFSATLFAACAVAQQTPPDAPPAPSPTQIISAKKIFIANADVEGNYARPDIFAGGPNRCYNQFYAAVKDWGRYDLVSTPGDADLVFEIRQTNLGVGGLAPELSLRIIDPRTHITLWAFSTYIDAATLTKTRERNYDTAMTELVNDLKIIATPAPPSPKNSLIVPQRCVIPSEGVCQPERGISRASGLDVQYGNSAVPTLPTFFSANSTTRSNAACNSAV
jgi:hypothetical protein